MRLPDGLGTDEALRDYLAAIDESVLPDYLAQLDPDELARVNRLLVPGPPPTPDEIDAVVAELSGWQHADQDDEGEPAG